MLKKRKFLDNIWNLFITLGKNKNEAISKFLLKLLAVLIDQTNVTKKLISLESKFILLINNYISSHKDVILDFLRMIGFKCGMKGIKSEL